MGRGCLGWLLPAVNRGRKLMYSTESATSTTSGSVSGLTPPQKAMPPKMTPQKPMVEHVMTPPKKK